MNKSSEISNIRSMEIYKWIKTIIFAIIIALLVKKYIFRSIVVKGQSMYPTMISGDRIICERLSLYIKKPKRGDIIIFHSPLGRSEDYIKRVIAVEGDSLRLEDGLIYVNGKKLRESYLEEGVRTPPGKNFQSSWKVGPGQLFVLGDNRDNSIDSRDFGEISIDSVKGRAVFRYWPIKEIGAIK